MISRRLAAAGMALLAATWMGAAHAQETKLTVIVFPGVQNLPMFAAQAEGFYAKRGLAVDLKIHAELGRASQRARGRALPDRPLGGRQCVRFERKSQCGYRCGVRR